MLKLRPLSEALQNGELEGVVAEVADVSAPGVGDAAVLREGDEALSDGRGGASAAADWKKAGMEVPGRWACAMATLAGVAGEERIGFLPVLSATPPRAAR